MASLGTHIPKEITEYKEKIIGGLTVRQLICVTAAVLVGIGSYFALNRLFGMSATDSSYIIMLLAAIPAAMGFIRPNGMDFEKYLDLRYQHKIGSDPRIYATEEEVTSANVVDKRKKEEQREYTTDYYVFSRRQRRRNIKEAKRHIRTVQKEIKASQKEFKRKYG